MKKIGVLFGQENTFPPALIEKINSENIKGIKAEAVKISKVIMGELNEYAVIIDRISQDIPFYRAYLKNAALSGTAVINNPFWWTADDKFFNNALATRIGVKVPKTVILPSKVHPDNTDSNSMRNLAYPLDWEAMFEYIGFPAYFKPFSGGGWKNVYRVESPEDFFKAYNETGQLVMMLQEEITFEDYYRCYSIDRRDVRIMAYDPRQPHHLRYVKNAVDPDKDLLKKIEHDVLKINNALGYDFNTVEFAVKDGVPYAIDFCNPAPDADIHSVGEENFEWVVNAVAKMAIRKAEEYKKNTNNLTWGDFVDSFVNGNKIKSNKSKNK